MIGFLRMLPRSETLWNCQYSLPPSSARVFRNNSLLLNLAFPIYRAKLNGFRIKENLENIRIARRSRANGMVGNFGNPIKASVVVFSRERFHVSFKRAFNIASLNLWSSVAAWVGK